MEAGIKERSFNDEHTRLVFNDIKNGNDDYKAFVSNLNNEHKRRLYQGIAPGPCLLSQAVSYDNLDAIWFLLSNISSDDLLFVIKNTDYQVERCLWDKVVCFINSGKPPEHRDSMLKNSRIL